MNNRNVKAIVFDLDGTLYEETHHFEYYAAQVAKRLRKEDQHRFWEDYRAVLSGRHPLRIGSVYDAGEDLILLLQNGIVSEAYRWNGEKLGAAEVKTIYPGQVKIDLDRLFSIGDNLENDILPARRLGCRTIFIDVYRLAKHGDADVIVASMSECVPVLRRFL
ncbi:hypothetical protein B1689_05825 [Geobacillus sp. 44C]|nr:hypothetical protein B1689_05825 [Geobacillus sp. 44C]QNU34664.1 HAD hydrolase-like protein [Geobacillus sp. 44C]